MDRFIEPIMDSSGTAYITENYDYIIKKLSIKLGDKNRATILLGDVYTSLRKSELNYTWKPNEGYLEDTVWKIILMYAKSVRYKNDFCDNESVLDNRSLFDIAESDCVDYNELDYFHDKDSAQLIYNKYLNTDTYNARLIIYTINNVESCLKVDSSIYDCLTCIEREDLKELLVFISKHSLDQLKGGR